MSDTPNRVRHIVRALDRMVDDFERSAAGLVKISVRDTIIYERSTYKLLVAKPSKRLAASLTVDRELAVVFTNFPDQQARTIRAVKHTIEQFQGRLESTLAIIVHTDPKGDLKLKNWGREKGVSILPVYYTVDLPRGEAFERRLCHEMYSHDPFDITGPVSGDAHFFGRRTEAQDLARKLQAGQIHSALGIRRIGKTSIINRVIADARESYQCLSVMVDCSRDDVWQMDAAQLLLAIANAVRRGIEQKQDYCIIEQTSARATIVEGLQTLTSEIARAPHPIILFFDEVDYITPSSPTATHWIDEFNTFWRNLRAVYQEASRETRKLALLVCGVSTKWFSAPSINGVENAALSLIPEEYLSPLPRRATIAMIKKVGRVAGLQFDEGAASRIAESCADMPFWVRKACSFIHRKIEITERPTSLSGRDVEPFLSEFIRSEGATLAHVALQHLFTVFPELEFPVKMILMGSHEQVSKNHITVLMRYGIVTATHPPALSGEMVRFGYEMFVEQAAANVKPQAPRLKKGSASSQGLDRWAEELAVIGKRRNMLEKELRGIILNFIRADFLQNANGVTVGERILASLPAHRRAEYPNMTAEQITEHLYWRDLVHLVAGKEWVLFGRLFVDRTQFLRDCDVINDRPDAHAKDYDAADFALYRRSLTAIEDLIGRVK